MEVVALITLWLGSDMVIVHDAKGFRLTTFKVAEGMEKV